MRKYFLIVVMLFVAIMALPQWAHAQENLGVNVQPFNLEQILLVKTTAQQDNIAEISLQQVALRDRTGRLIGGGTLLAFGVLCYAGSYSSLDTELIPALLKVTGGTLAGIGGIVLLIPKSSEKEYNKVMRISDPGKREIAAMDSLDYLADKAQRSRVMTAIGNFGVAGYELYSYFQARSEGSPVSNSIMYSSMIFAGTGLYNLLVPSYVERVDERVKKSKDLSFNFMIGEKTGPVLSFNF